MIPGISFADTLLKTAGGHLSRTNNSHQHLARMILQEHLGEMLPLKPLMVSFVWICYSGARIVVHQYEEGLPEFKFIVDAG